MSNPVEVVRDHLAAVADYDWDGVKRSMSPNVDLKLDGVADWDWTFYTLYRNVTQAWDFTLADTQLSEGDDGAVTGVVRLINQGWVKDVMCQYHVTQDRIVSITLSDSAPTQASMPKG